MPKHAGPRPPRYAWLSRRLAEWRIGVATGVACLLAAISLPFDRPPPSPFPPRTSTPPPAPRAPQPLSPTMTPTPTPPPVTPDMPP